MRFLQRNVVGRLGAAATVSLAITLVGWRGDLSALAALLFAALTVVVFVALTIAPDAIALWRRHHWRWWWRASDDQGPFWPGTRIPRGPKGPRR